MGCSFQYELIIDQKAGYLTQLYALLIKRVFRPHNLEIVTLQA